MDKKSAYKILGLSEDTERYKVEIRYLLLMKKLKLKEVEHLSKEQLKKKIEELNYAYDTIIDRCVNEEALNDLYPIRKKGLHNKLIYSIIESLSRFLALYKYKLLIVISSLAAILIIVGIMTYKHPDLRVLIIKDVAFDKNSQIIKTDLKDLQGMCTKITNLAPEINNPKINVNSEYFDFDTYSVQSVALNIFGHETDVMIIEESELDKFCKLGGFTKLDAYASELGVTKENGKRYYFRLNRKEDKSMFGIHVENNPILKGIWTNNKPAIAVIYDSAKYKNSAVEFLKLLSVN